MDPLEAFRAPRSASRSASLLYTPLPHILPHVLPHVLAHILSHTLPRIKRLRDSNKSNIANHSYHLADNRALINRL